MISKPESIYSFLYIFLKNKSLKCENFVVDFEYGFKLQNRKFFFRCEYLLLCFSRQPIYLGKINNLSLVTLYKKNINFSKIVLMGE